MSVEPLRGPSLLLLELAPDQPERRFRADSYPFLLGLARRLGWEASWAALGVRFDPRLRYEVEAAPLRALLGLVDRLGPSVIVVNERLAPEQEASLSRGRRLLYCPLSEAFASRFLDFCRELAPGAVLPPSIEEIEPVYERSTLDEAPSTVGPLLRVFSGPRCPLPGTAQACSFCGVPHEDDPLRDGLGFAVRQIAAACRQRGAADRRLRFEVIGQRQWRRLPELASRLAREGVSRVELDFMPRIDEILAARQTLERTLPLLAERGIILRLYGAGVENFAAGENARLNKGISPEQAHEAAAFLLEAARRWPEAFRFDSLSMILFTPWTTLEDLRENLGHIRRCPVICPATAFGSVLQLFEDRPITALARRDGLLAERRGGFYNSGCIIEEGVDELPWRFGHPEVAGLCELGRRLRTAGSALPDSVVLAIFDAALARVEKDRRPRPLAELLPAAAALAHEAARERARAVDEILREAEGRAFYREGLVELELDGKAYPLLLTPRAHAPGPSYFDLPSLRVCLRGEVPMSPEEQRLLRRWLERLSPLDARLAQALPAASACEAAALRFGGAAC